MVRVEEPTASDRSSENLFLLNSTQILNDLQNSFSYNLLRVARHIQQ
jgi:hypothetical protein